MALHFASCSDSSEAGGKVKKLKRKKIIDNCNITNSYFYSFSLLVFSFFFFFLFAFNLNMYYKRKVKLMYQKFYLVDFSFCSCQFVQSNINEYLSNFPYPLHSLLNSKFSSMFSISMASFKNRNQKLILRYRQ